MAGSLETAAPENKKPWKTIRESFKNVFNKKITGEFYFDSGGRVGLELGDSNLSAFDTFSTGELEYISLLCDLLTEKEVDLFLIDEIDAHFHPDLQKKLISEIDELIKDKTILFTTHSPSVMLSVPPENLFFLNKAEDVKPGENQITCLSEDFKLMESISAMYAGFVSDIRLSKHYFHAANLEILKYACNCFKESQVIGQERAKGSDPQTTLIRAFMLASTTEKSIADIGAGKGRLLSAFKNLNDEQLKKINYLAVDDNDKNLKELDSFAETEGLKNKFKTFITASNLDSNNKHDLFILANVVHEVGPDKLMQFFNDIFRSASTNSKIVILEALELAVGEKRFVLFDSNALDRVFGANIQANNISITTAKPDSYRGTPLLEYVVTIVNDPIPLTIDDIKAGLTSVVALSSKEIAEHIKKEQLDERNLSREEGRSLAFKCHNLANASAYLEIIENVERTLTP